MRALFDYGPEDIRATNIQDPRLNDDHAMLVEVSATSICGSDLHVYRGVLDSMMEKGRSQTGHELIGRVKEIGKDVGRFKPGDRVSMAYSCSCGDCYMCNVGQTAHCETTNKAVYGFGVPFGDLNGTHAEALILPMPTRTPSRCPTQFQIRAGLMLSCNLPSAIIANKLADIAPGENVALIGCGPTGLMCLDIALQKSAGTVVAMDKVAHRLSVAAKKGAVPINPSDSDWMEKHSRKQARGVLTKSLKWLGIPKGYRWH
uniref:Alcohol dehydrogenase-like N-terminal domain-containing protein n=1 Tax=Stutzerimonas stutzeri TaxID=316 RepID=Q9R6Q5_STUST|nr:hypothetical protein [Pseudomonas sp. OX1]